MNIRPLLRTLSTLLIFNLYAAAQSKPAADLIITHAKIWTVDQAHPEAQAVAILRDRIVAVGTNADVDAWRGPKTGIIDAGGKLLLPGFNDCARPLRERWRATRQRAVERRDQRCRNLPAASANAPRRRAMDRMDSGRRLG